MAQGKPRYRDIHRALLTDIARKRIVPGDMMPSEHALCRRFSTSRFTVRSALKLLDEAGMVVNLPGRGWRLENAVPVERPVLAPAGRALHDNRTILYLGRNERCSASVFDRLQATFGRQGIGVAFQPLVNYTLDASSLEELRHHLDPKRLHAAVIFADEAPPQRLFAIAAEQDVPLTVVGLRRHPPGCDTVCGDYFAASRSLTERLLGQGHRHIVFVSYRPLLEENPSFRSRLQGCRRALEAYDEKPELLLLDQNFFLEEPTHQLDRWFTERSEAGRPITAVFLSGTYSDLVPVLLERLGLRVPEDISLCGFDIQTPYKDDYRTTHDLTRIIEPWPEIAQTAAIRILARLHGYSLPPALTLVPAPIHPGSTIAAARTAG